MQSVSPEFLAAIMAPERQIKHQVQIVFLDNAMLVGAPTFVASSTLDATLTPASHAFNGKQAPQSKFAWCGDDTFPASDIYPVAGDGSSEIGWWSNTSGDASGNFATAETLAIDCQTAQAFGSLSLHCDSRFGYPVNFQVHYSNIASPTYTDWTLVTTVTGNATTVWTYSISPIVSARWLRLSVTKWSIPSKRMKIIEFEGGYTVDVSDQVKSFSLTKERSADDEGTTLPYGNSSANELSLVLDNTSGDWYTRNTASPYYGYLKTDRKVLVWLGVVKADGTTEFVPQGTFYTVGWSGSLLSAETTVTARDMAKRMMDIDFASSPVYENRTCSQLVTTVAQAWGLTTGDYIIDPTTEVIPYAYFKKGKYWTDFDQLADGETGAVYVNELNQLVFENRSHLFLTRLASTVSVAATSFVVISALGLNVGDTLYVSDNVNTELVTIAGTWNGTSTTVPTTTAFMHGYIANSFCYKRAVAATLDDTNAVMDVDDQYILDKTRNKIEVVAMPYAIPLDGMGNVVRDYVWKLTEGLTVPASSALDIDVSFEKEPVLSDISNPLNIVITTSLGTDSTYITTSWQPTVYGWGGTLRLTNSKASAVLIIGLTIDGVALSQTGTTTITAQDPVLIAQQGERLYTVNSQFIQKRTHASAIANNTLQIWKDPSRPVKITGIGLPHLQTSDHIKLSDSKGLSDANLNNHFYITRITLEYDGGLDGTYDGLDAAPAIVGSVLAGPTHYFVSLAGTLAAIGALTVAGGGPTHHFVSLTGGLATSGSVTKRVNKRLAGALATAAAFAIGAAHHFNVSLAGNLTLNPIPLVQDLTMTIGSLGTTLIQGLGHFSYTIGAGGPTHHFVSLGGALATTGTLTIGAGGHTHHFISLAGTLATSGSVTKDGGAANAIGASTIDGGAAADIGASTIDGGGALQTSITKSVNKRLAGALGTAGSITMGAGGPTHHSVSLAGTLATTGTLAKRVNKRLAGTLATTGTIAIGGGSTQLLLTESGSYLLSEDSIHLSVEGSNTSQLLFDDEFAGSTLNSAWTNGLFWWGDGITGAGIHEQEGYQSSQATVSGGMLNLTAINQADPASGRPYTSGMIATGGVSPAPPGYQYTYGYAEASIKVPAGNGMWPAFWLWLSSNPPEIDIMEQLGSEPTTYYATAHRYYDSRDITNAYNGVTLANDFHVYAVDWQPTYIKFYFDGTLVATYDDSAQFFNKPMFLILNLALGGDWAGTVDESKLPATMLVDWVKVWQTKP